MTNECRNYLNMTMAIIAQARWMKRGSTVYKKSMRTLVTAKVRARRILDEAECAMVLTEINKALEILREQ